MSFVILQYRALAHEEGAVIKGATHAGRRTQIPAVGKMLRFHEHDAHAKAVVSHVDRLMTPPLVHLTASQDDLMIMVMKLGWRQLV